MTTYVKHPRSWAATYTSAQDTTYKLLITTGFYLGIGDGFNLIINHPSGTDWTYLS